MSGVVLLNLLSIFLTESTLKLSVASTIQTSLILYSRSPIVVLLQTFPFSTAIFTDIALRKSRILFLRRVRTIRSSTHSYPFQVTLPNPRTLARKSSFIPRTSQLWNSLPPTSFPESYNLSSFKSSINKLDLVSLST